MARTAWQLGMGTVGLLAALPGASLAAQTPYLRGTDAVSIGRAGAGVAYGRSLEAASINPALLVTLQDPRAAYLSLGMEMQASNSTLQSNSDKLTTSDRNRFLPSFGMAWKLSPTFAWGIKLDTPVLRHGTLPTESTSRFAWEGIDLSVQRLEVQGSWALSDRLSLGAGLGLARIAYASDVSVRTIVPEDASQPYNSSTNPALALAEQSLHQSGSAMTGCLSLGFRYAINSRWTAGGSYSKILRANPSMDASKGRSGATTALDGYGVADAGADAAAVQKVLGATRAVAGSGSVEIPGVATLGIRHRFNRLFTWEVDVRYTQGASLKLPSQPGLLTSDGTAVAAAVVGTGYRNALGVSAMGEISFTKRLTGRIGVALDAATVTDQNINPIVGGAASSTISLGLGYQIWGGEFNVGVQVRQARDADSDNLDLVWRYKDGRADIYPSGTKTRVEGTGYTWALGFRRSF